MLTHGIGVTGDYLFASSEDVLYRWPYSEGQRDPLDDERRQVVIYGMNELDFDPHEIVNHNHRSRPFEFDLDGNIYVALGSYGNIDPTPFRSRIRRFPADLVVAAQLPPNGTSCAEGEVFADGLRNSVGLGWDFEGVLWGVISGENDLFREDLGGDIAIGNPAEELNRYQPENAGQFYGYPYCWTEGQLELGRATTNNIPPVAILEAHTTPLDLEFYGVRFPKSICGSMIGAEIDRTG
ncbi:unnamed protein product [Vitrella brassicaformis CCMP3155]|uniref:Pyrroloquinoline quinone-dependent pyranose dehydrogenase beta-propeller domain-containing protein n=1 Tax=Vitrella brassicaformis (strain CCMP3155) TaxID=1169540 RepID=A0A0G4H6D9_VITBC|nr:unnamed protein product [Vitrella brassicaformis CCMP3155]|eukprot:CEM39179.1 unnamed protein product [Vitrella brassicaformis CCMP3155]